MISGLVSGRFRDTLEETQSDGQDTGQDTSRPGFPVKTTLTPIHKWTSFAASMEINQTSSPHTPQIDW